MTPTKQRMDELWREMLSWPLNHRMAFVTSLAHGVMDDNGSTLVDGGMYDRIALTDVYVIAGRGVGAGQLRDAVTAMVAKIDGRNSVVHVGPGETPLKAAARGGPQFVGETGRSE